jgi:hypothetical protein
MALLQQSTLRKTILCLVLLASICQPMFGNQSAEKQVASTAAPVIWRDPGDIASRDLSFGPGSAEFAPVPPFKFVKEDKDGESPKFIVTDARNVKWSVKLGTEAQPETVATRLVWAVGYFAEESYYFDRLEVENLPRLSRGRQFVSGKSTVVGARLEPRRKDVIRGDTWDWNKNRFAGTRELNGLKVIMILLNNYDARKDNNRILIVRNTQTQQLEARYVVCDLGATLGKSGGLGGTRSKNDLEDFLSTRFVMGVKDGIVEFDYDTRPTGFGIVSVLYPPYYKGEVKKEKSMRGIPVEHARWVGSLLTQLTEEQVHSAFRAARYEEETMESYVRALLERIGQLTRI